MAPPIVWLDGALKLIVCAANTTAKLWLTGVAAKYVVFPDCEAVMVQLPAAIKVIVVPLIVHTVGVVDANSTDSPEVEVAASAGGATPMVCVVAAAKLMVCAACTTVKFWLTGVAAAKVPFPACVAVTVHVPADSRFKVVPLTVQTAGVLTLNCTLKPELDVAISAGGAAFSVCVGGAVKVMVCEASATVNVCKAAGAEV